MKALVTAIAFAATLLSPAPISYPIYNSEVKPAEENIAPATPEVHPVGHIQFSGAIDETSVNAILEMMAAAEALKVEHLVLEINSPGGIVDEGFRLAKAVESFPVPVHCVVDGQADSMAFYLLQSCTTRSMTKRSILMAHEPSLGGMIHGNQYTFRELANVLEALSAAMAEHEAARMCISVDEFRKRTANQDYWMGWHEAMNIAAVDYVVTSVEDVLIPLALTGYLPLEFLLQSASPEFCPQLAN